MLLWALLVTITLIVGTSLPPVQAAIQITSLNLGDWPLIIAVTFASTFWMELEKILKKST
jgi:flagellar biosynthesis protein FliQ